MKLSIENVCCFFFYFFPRTYISSGDFESLSSLVVKFIFLTSFCPTLKFNWCLFFPVISAVISW